MLNRISTSVHCMLMYGYVVLAGLSQILYLVFTVSLLPGNAMVRAMPDQSAVLVVYVLMGYGLAAWSCTRDLARFVRHSWLTVILSPIAGTILWLITWTLLEARRDVLFGALSKDVSASAYMAYGLMIALGPFFVLAVWHGLCCRAQNGENQSIC